jgi:hypothetical protein
MIAWSGVAQLVERMPPVVWIALVAGNAVMTLGTWSVARRRMRRAGERAADPQVILDRAARKRDTALAMASLIPAGLFWAMVLAGSFHGLIAFGRGVLGWHDGWEYLVPGTLDGVSVTFAFLAFRAVRMQKAPDRCYRVVWGAAVASATVNFAYESTHSGHNLIAGGYLALLSLFGMVMLHEFLAQFEEGAAYVKRSSPKFGLRWITWPSNTLCAAIAWRNYPPAEGTEATILNAVANLDRGRALKQKVRDAKVVARHQEALAAARRHEELQAAEAGPGATGSAVASDVEAAAPVNVPIPGPTFPAEPVEVATPPVLAQPATPGPPAPRRRRKRVDDEPRAAGMRVPSTAATLRAWASLWVRMCADPEVGLGPLNDDDVRARYGLISQAAAQCAPRGDLRRTAAEGDRTRS